MYHGHLMAPWQSDPDLYFGKHRRVPVPPPVGGYRFQDPAMVSRAIPVDGAVTEPGPSWARSPQARFWLEPEPVSIRELIRRKLKKAVSWWDSCTAGDGNDMNRGYCTTKRMEEQSELSGLSK